MEPRAVEVVSIVLVLLLVLEVNGTSVPAV
jgi:hypothetical protein